MVTINEPSSPLTISLNTSPITCIGSGSLIIEALGGWGGYVYTLTLPDSTVLPGQSTNTFINLTQAGTYTISVEDANGCIITDTFSLTIPNPPTANISTTSDICYDTSDNATIIIDVTSGEAPFEFSINGGPYLSTNIFSNLTPGSYTITVRDAFGCETTLPAVIIAPQLLVNTVLTEGLDCTVTPDALITGNITGGTAPFSYAVAIDGAPFSSLGAVSTPFTYTTGTTGTYQFQITDAIGCIAESQIITINPCLLYTSPSPRDS